MEQSAVRKIIAYAAIYTIWSSTYFLIKVAVRTMPPIWLLALRWSVGGMLFLLFPVVQGKVRSWPTRKEILSAVVLGIFFMLLGNGLVSVAEKKIDSYLAALIVASVPFCVALFNRVIFKIKISWVKVVAIALGMMGVALLLYRGDSSIALGPEVLMVVGAMLFWSFGSCLAPRMKLHENAFLNAGMQMFSAGIISLLIALFSTDNISGVFAQFSSDSLFSFALLVVFGSSAIAAYNYLLKRDPVLRISTYTFVNPVIATLIGVVAAGEIARPLLFAGLPLILLGLLGILYGDRILKPKTDTSLKPVYETLPEKKRQ